MMIMNILAVFLVLSSIGAGVLSPNPGKKNSREDDMIAVIKEAAHPAVVFIDYHETEIQPNKNEYERVVEANETPITESSPSVSSPTSILTQFQYPFKMEQRGLQSLVGNANEKMREACSVLLNLCHGISGESLSSEIMSKQVINEALKKAKDLVIETGKKTHDFKQVAFESATESFKKIPAEKAQLEKQAIGDAKEKVLEKIQDLSEGIGYVKEKITKRVVIPQTLSKQVLDKAYDLKEATPTPDHASERIGGAIEDKILDKSQEYYLKGVYVETAMKAKEKVSDKARLFKETAAGAKDTVSRKALDFKEAIEESTAAETPAKEKVMNRMPETIVKASEQVSGKSHGFKEDMKETVAMAAPPHEEVTEGLFSKSREKVLKKAHELETSSNETIVTATERAKRYLVDFKYLYHMIETSLTDNRTAKVKTTHFFIEGRHNFTTLFTKSFLFVYHTSDETVNWSVGVLRLMGFTTAYGSCVWVTFVSSHVLSGALPRQQYGMVQSKIYLVYFRVMASTLGLSFWGHFLTRHHKKSSPYEKLHGYDLMASIGLVLINLFLLEPLATKVLLDIMKWEKEEVSGTAAEPSSVNSSRMVGEVEAQGSERQADGEVREENRTQNQAQLERLNKRLKKLNSISAFCNILTLMLLTSHLASLSYCLYASC